MAPGGDSSAKLAAKRWSDIFGGQNHRLDVRVRVVGRLLKDSATIVWKLARMVDWVAAKLGVHHEDLIGRDVVVYMLSELYRADLAVT